MRAHTEQVGKCDSFYSVCGKENRCAAESESSPGISVTTAYMWPVKVRSVACGVLVGKPVPGWQAETFLVGCGPLGPVSLVASLTLEGPVPTGPQAAQDPSSRDTATV